MFEDLDVTADLFASAEFSSTTKDEIGNQFIATAGFLVDNNLSSTKNGNLANGFHKCILNIFRPDLLRISLPRIRSLFVSL